MQLAYDAVIPAHVLLDENLSDAAKLFYAVIRGLSREKGYCWATNTYLAKYVKKSPTTIKTLIKQLRECGYIVVEVIRNEETHEVLKRRIYIAEAYWRETASESHSQGSDPPQTESCPTPQTENCPRVDRKLSIDNIDIINNNIKNDIFYRAPTQIVGSLTPNEPANKKINPPEDWLEVRDYFEQEEIETDPKRFFYYYEARSWRGIDNWHAAAQAWQDIGQNKRKHANNNYNDEPWFHSLDEDDINNTL